MILEVAILNVIPHRAKEFESSFQKAQQIIMSTNGYVTHELQKCIETPNRYILLVTWQTLEDHIDGFRKSEEYQEWRKLLHHFYDPFPTVEHYQKVDFPSPAGTDL